MKSKKCLTTKISQARMNSSTINTTLRKPKAKGVCQRYYMKLRSGFTIQKEYHLRNTKTPSPKTAGKYKDQHLLITTCHRQMKHLKKSVASFPIETSMVQRCATTTDVPYYQSIQEFSAFLSTYNDQSVSFICENEDCEIYIEDVGQNHKKDEVLLRFYDSQSPSNKTGDGVDGQMVMVSLSPTKGKDLWVYAIKEELSVKLQKCEEPPPDKALFLLHQTSPQSVQFECRSNPGVFIGVKDNQLALIKVEDQTENLSRENTIFKLS
ncbi:interleukin-33 [Talpa occidentalis]|uniref:interleukin-33 n=1 Tax=Talpa occidentalis TaxID=50954 RepID=UPI00188DFD9D|nr:interleukin-33 [Talpa occidentalis]XP_037349799.1 interleukin-33 [Talpa occidentalis]XP_054545280.1 interleukin-33 [Talpa occidentalis]XP_054545281.1 interleukin-33 [Talpa occidentalis]